MTARGARAEEREGRDIDTSSVGVVIPVHDSRSTLPRALRSILRQTRPVQEIVVVDDRSTDGVEELVAGWDDPRVRLVRSDGPGPAAARNTGVAALSSELVAFLDSDDVWYADKLERQLPLLTPDAALVGGLVHYLGETGEVLGTHVPFDDWDDATASARAGESLPVPTTSVVLRREDFHEHGGYDTSFRQSEDLELVARLLQGGRRLVWPPGRILAGYVLSRSGLTRKRYREQFLAAELVRARLQGRTDATYEEWMASPAIDRRTWRRMHSGDRYRRAAVARGSDQPGQYVVNGALALALDPVSSVAKLNRRRRPREPVVPATPPPEVLADLRAGAAPSWPDARPTTHDVAGLRLLEDPLLLPAAVLRARACGTAPVVVHAAHVTSLNARDVAAFRDAFNAADLAHADGISWSLLARAAGRRAGKLATTEVVPMLLTALEQELGRTPTVVVIGGEPGVAQLGVPTLESLGADVIGTHHGYHDDWEPVLADLRSLGPDLVLVGLGMPLEAFWTQRHREALPDSVVVTCGGLLRLLAHTEQRAPRVMQRLELEWLYRIAHDPRRTAVRYGSGVYQLVRALPEAVRRSGS